MGGAGTVGAVACPSLNKHAPGVRCSLALPITLAFLQEMYRKKQSLGSVSPTQCSSPSRKIDKTTIYLTIITIITTTVTKAVIPVYNP